MVIGRDSNFVDLDISGPQGPHRQRLVRVAVRSGAFWGDRAETWIEAVDFDGFLDELRRLERTRQGRASMAAEDSRQFQLTLAAVDRSGHLEVSGRLAQGGTHGDATLEFRFNLDPGLLPQVLKDFELASAAA